LDAQRGCDTRELAAQIAALLRESAEVPDCLRQRLHDLAQRVSARFSDEEQSEWYEAAIYRPAPPHGVPAPKSADATA
jgi:hypothetical protein